MEGKNSLQLNNGAGKRKKEEISLENPVLLDSIKLRYSTETIAEESVAAEEAPEQEAKQGRNRNRRRRGKTGARPLRLF